MRLRAALTVLEKRQDGHHVVAFDPSDRDVEASGRRVQRRSSRGREEPRVTRGRRVVRETDDDLEEVVRTSRRRAMRTGDLAEGEGDKIQIEVGAVKGLQSKRGVKRGMYWVVLMSLFLFWVPVIGPAVAGYIGGRKAGTPLRAFFASMIPVIFIFGALAAASASMAGVSGLVKHFIEAASAGVVGSSPFNIPLVGYVMGNLAALMRAGPDSLFLLVAFAMAGGAISEMKIQERMVPPITARVPASRLASPMVQVPARATSSARQGEIDGLVAELNDALARAEKERKAFERARGSHPVGVGASGRSRFSIFGGRSERTPTVALAAAEADADVSGLDPAGRRVVTEMLASTPPARGERRARVVKVPTVDMGLPQAIAYAGPSRAAGAEGRTSAHQYRASKYYHIYGGSVNPVARAKLEKRLRRTHTLHAMRRGNRGFAEMVEVDARGSHAEHAPEIHGLDHPRSLEPSALEGGMHYDALEHLENAHMPAVRHSPAPAKKPAAADDLGGLIAHLGEGGEAVVDGDGVKEVEFGAGPQFDRRGRQRARIALDEDPARSPLGPVPKSMMKTPAVVRQAITSVEKTAKKAEAPQEAKLKIARSADRATLSPLQDAKVNRWLKKTIATIEVDESKPKAASPKGEEPKPKPKAKEAEAIPTPEAEAGAPAEHRPAAHRKSKDHSPSFDIVKGATEVDVEADVDEGDSPSPRKNRSASDILREIRAQKKAEKDAEPGEEIARAAKRAKVEADEIERVATDDALPAVAEVALAATSKADDAPKAPSKRRSHADELEEVRSDAERLGGDLELTLSPIREEPVEIHEIGEVHAMGAESEARPAEAPPAVSITEIATTAGLPASLEPERDVELGEVVLAGPSTDVAVDTSAEADLSAHDQEKIRKRLQEGWNRL